MAVKVNAAVALVLLGLLTYAAWPWLPGQQSGLRTVVVYGFSILGETMNESLFPAFQADWKQRTGEQVELISSFAGSGTVTNQILLGVPAQVAILATGLDADKLQKAGYAGSPRVLNRTPFVILVRPGNPHKITDFADLARPGLKIVHPDPLTSGAAQWAILAEYASALRTGATPEEASARLGQIWKNVVSQANSAQAARTQFESGLGDALITYEQDLLRDRARGRLKGEIVYPVSTVLSEHVLVTVKRNIPPADQALVDGFVAFLDTDPAQRIFAQNGFRSVREAFNQEFTPIARPFVVAELGGWPAAKRDIIERIWRDQVLVEVER